MRSITRRSAIAGIGAASLVRQMIAKTGENIRLRRFTRYKMGEGLAKREDDFGDEVAKLAGS